MEPTYQTADGAVRLWLGDALDILPTLEPGSVNMIFTDPPYGHNNNNNNDLIHRWEAALGCGPVVQEDARPIANDGKKEASELVRFLFAQAARLLPPGCCCCCCCCGGGGPDPQFARWSLWMDEVLQFKQMVIWDKGPMGMGWHYRRSYETVLVGEKPGAPCRWFGGRVVENIIRPGRYGIHKIIPDASQHPTEKCPELAAHFVRLHSQTHDTILDPFMGSGTTGIACIRTGRRFLGIEIDERYFNMARERIERELNRTPLFDPKPQVQTDLL